MDYLYYFGLLILFDGLRFLANKYWGRIAKNKADIKQNKDKEYQSEKGRNLATKEDIQEITEKIESVKSEISLINQWKQEHINRREQRLIEILHLAELISMSYNKIIVLYKNADNIGAYFKIIDSLNNYMAEMTHQGNLIIVDNNNLKDLSPVANLVDTLTKYGMELSVLANNIASTLNINKVFTEEAFKDLDSPNVSISLKNVLVAQATAQNYIEAPLQFKESADKAINAYITWLSGVYNMHLLIDYPVQKID